jgi:hypothetical protein
MITWLLVVWNPTTPTQHRKFVVVHSTNMFGAVLIAGLEFCTEVERDERHGA